MHDSQIEERLRSVLRDEGQHLPQTITTAELERRLATRRRQARGRRISLLAAAVAVVAVVVIGALGNGWLRPAIGSQASPSPTNDASPSSSLGLAPIVQAVDGRLVAEILPTVAAAGDTRAVHGDVAAGDYVVSVKVECIGRGAISFTDRTHIVETTCTDTAALDPSFQPEPTLVPIVNGSFDTTLTVAPGLTYAMLVETVPLPDHIPLLALPKGAIAMSSTSVRPNTDAPRTSTNTASGRMDGPTEWIQVVCLGPGVVAYTLGPVDHSVPATSSEAICDGVPHQEEIAVDFAGSQIISVTTDGRIAWQLVATRSGPLPDAVGRGPLGPSSGAILVKPIGDPAVPERLEVSLFDPNARVPSRLLATIPGSFLATGDTLDGARPPAVSLTGWLAIPSWHAAGAGGESTPAIVIVDLRDPTAPPWLLEGYRSGAWNDADELAVAGNGVFALADPASRTVAQVSGPDAADIGVVPQTGNPVWSAAAGSRFLALEAGAANTWGVLDADGVFTPTNDLPAAVQRTGLERVTGAGSHTLTMGCDASGSATGSGCFLVEDDVNNKVVATRVDATAIGGLYDFAWSADGKAAWLLFDGGAGENGYAVSLQRSTTSGRDEVGRIDLGPDEQRGQIVGIGPESTADGVGYVAVGDEAGFVRGFVRDDSSGVITPDVQAAWFAGWAGIQPAYDPD